MSEKIKVLIAEDDFIISEEISRIVRKLGYQKIGSAGNGEKAVEMALKSKPDVVLMDIKMPKLDGLEAARQITLANSDIAVILLTAHESRDLIEKASESGIAAYLTKPPKAEEIDRAISIALARTQDLGRTRKLVQELERHKQQLHESNASKDRFFSIIAHDLRNPVASLYSFTEYLEQHAARITPDNMLHYIQAIHTTSKSLFDLLDELLLWGRLQSGRIQINAEDLDLRDIALSIASLMNASALSKNIIINNLVDSGISVFADKTMLKTILRNLVSNAVKFTPDNGTVAIDAELVNNEVHITVSDTGVGIDKVDIDRLFKIDDQFTTPGTNGEKGTGLGLVLCKEMVERNGGKIWVESTQGNGSRFIFALPTHIVVPA